MQGNNENPMDLNPNSPIETIKNKYRTLALEYLKGKIAAEKFKVINAAYDKLIHSSFKIDLKNTHANIRVHITIIGENKLKHEFFSSAGKKKPDSFDEIIINAENYQITYVNTSNIPELEFDTQLQLVKADIVIILAEQDLQHWLNYAREHADSTAYICIGTEGESKFRTPRQPYNSKESFEMYLSKLIKHMEKDFPAKLDIKNQYEPAINKPNFSEVYRISFLQPPIPYAPKEEPNAEVATSSTFQLFDGLKSKAKILGSKLVAAGTRLVGDDPSKNSTNPFDDEETPNNDASSSLQK